MMTNTKTKKIHNTVKDQSWKISSSLSRSFLVRLVMVSGTAMAWDRQSGEEAALPRDDETWLLTALPVWSASSVANLKGTNTLTLLVWLWLLCKSSVISSVCVSIFGYTHHAKTKSNSDIVGYLHFLFSARLCGCLFWLGDQTVNAFQVIHWWEICAVTVCIWIFLCGSILNWILCGRTVSLTYFLIRGLLPITEQAQIQLRQYRDGKRLLEEYGVICVQSVDSFNLFHLKDRNILHYVLPQQLASMFVILIWSRMYIATALFIITLL